MSPCPHQQPSETYTLLPTIYVVPAWDHLRAADEGLLQEPHQDLLAEDSIGHVQYALPPQPTPVLASPSSFNASNRFLDALRGVLSAEAG